MTGAAAVDAYIAAAPDAFRATLQDLRHAIATHLAARNLAYEECLSYGMPGFRLMPAGKRGKMVAGYAAHTHVCGFYPHSGTVLPQMADSLGQLRHTKSAISFTPDAPLPTAILRRALDLRLVEIGQT